MLDGIYKDKNGNPLKIGDYVVFDDREYNDEIKLLKLDFEVTEAAIVCREIDIHSVEKKEEYEMLNDTVSLIGEMSQEGCIYVFTKLDKATTDKQAYELYKKVVEELEGTLLDMTKLKKTNPRLYYTILAMEAGNVNFLEIEDENQITYRIDKESKRYLIAKIKTDGEKETIERYKVQI